MQRPDRREPSRLTRAGSTPALAAILLFAVLLAPGSATAKDVLSVGDRAPEFEFQGSDDKTYSLQSLRADGKRGIVLAFFPKAFTPGWTAELESLRDSEKALAEFDVAYFMVSLDSPEKNRDFADSVGAHFVLLSDPDKQSAKRFGVLGLGGFYARRWTFYIDPEGIIRAIDKDVETGTHGEDVVRELERLRFPKR